MNQLGTVQQKISCAFETQVTQETSSKRAQQTYKVVASERLRNIHKLENSVSSEKLDGTCTYIQIHNDKPWLWARLDRKPNKAADKRFKKFQSLHRAWQISNDEAAAEPLYQWDVETDFKDVPSEWLPAKGVPIVSGKAQPDDAGHTPGWVPVDPSSRQHLWHLSSVDLVRELALVLQPLTDAADSALEITTLSLKELCDCTLELIGTNVNGNPYKLGSKDNPIHVLVRHGIIGFKKPPPLDYHQLSEWFTNDVEGRVEGVVWHCKDGELYKVHRHHLGLPWPVDNLRLNAAPVKINVDASIAWEASSSFAKLASHNGVVLNSLTELDALL